MRTFGLLLLLGLIALESHAGDSIAEKGNISPANQIAKESKFYYGGYLNLTFGSYTALGIEPLIGYKINPKLSAGAIVTYEYIRDNGYSGYTYKASNYGASIFGRYRVIPQFYLHAEFKEMNYDSYYLIGQNNRIWVPFLLLGGGYSQQISRNTWMNTQILFDVLQNENSPYRNWTPFFNIGFGVGF